jgi:hypothetical protein
MSTNQFRHYLDLLNEDPELSNPTQPSSEPRCVVCGTPKSQHQALQHQFVAGGEADRPASVAQGGSAGGGDIGRIKKLQAELKAAGANLGSTGANRDGIDGDIGPLTTTAMSNYPNIAAKYPDLSGSSSAAPTAQAATPAVDTKKLDAALTAIEGILAKYKVKLSEDRESSTTDQMKQWRRLVEYREVDEEFINGNWYPAGAAAPTATSQPAAQRTMPRLSEANLTPAQQAANRAGIGIPGLATAPPAAPAGKGAVRTAAGALGKQVSKLSPGVGLALAVPDVYDRAKAGDYTGATISGLAGLASLVPLKGTAIALGLGGLNAWLDSKKTPTVAISAEDAKIIADNVKILQDLGKDPANQNELTPELKTRIANTLKGVSSLGIPTQDPTPSTAQQAATPTAPQPAAPQPAAKPATNSPAAAKLAPTLDGIDKLLKQYNFESQDFDSFFDSLTESEQRKFILKNLHLLSESEQMAERRDMLNEAGAWGLGQKGLRWAGEKLYKAGGGIVGPPVPAAGKTPWWKPGFKTTLAIGAGGGIYGYFAIKGIISGLLDTIKDPETAKVITITPEDTAAWIKFNKELEAALPDQAAYNALPQETKDRLSMIAARAEAMDKAMRASRKTTQ